MPIFPRSKLLEIILQLEPFILLMITLAFWYATPIRDQWVWLIGLLLPIFGARYLLRRRVWTETPLNEFLIGFIALCLLNIFTAPFETRGLILLFRPLFGIALFFYLIEYARYHGHLKLPFRVTMIGAIVLSIVALTATKWSEGKTAFSAITSIILSYPSYPGAEGLINPNELAGAITWLAPLCLGLVFYYWKKEERTDKFLAGIGGQLLMIALLFGQSLSGMLGLAAGFLILFTPRRLWMWSVGVIVALVVIAQTVILVAPSSALDIAGTLSGRPNLNSLDHREVIWISARQAVIDHPFTGIGMAMYRSPVVWEIYPTPGYDRYLAPHAHNELLHIATDLGVPGAILFLSWYAIAVYILYYSWKHGDTDARHIVAAVSAGLLAHLVYSLTDAIPLWDRFAFIFYWLLGLAGAQYVIVRQSVEAKYSHSESRA
jgi:putative inorganic carbon (hco3(-)) transporter